MRSLLLALGLAACGTAAPAHSWYDSVCCNNRDCVPSSEEYLTFTKEGITVTLHPGDHPLVKKSVTRHFPWAQVRPSQDADVHICALSQSILCVYVPFTF